MPQKPTAEKRNYVLDTNILISSPHALLSFDEHHVYITDTTLEELDGLKKRPDEVGANARKAIRLIGDLSKGESLLDGIDLPSGGSLQLLCSAMDPIPQAWGQDNPDNSILRICSRVQTEIPNLTLVSNDIAMRIKAAAAHLSVEEYKTEQAPADSIQYKGRCELWATQELIDDFYKNAFLSTPEIETLSSSLDEPPLELSINEFVILRDISDPRHTATGKFDGERIVKLQFHEKRPYGVLTRNIGQRFAVDALLTPASELPLVVLQGPAGTAKTFLSIAAGLEQVVNSNAYVRILVTRPNIKFDEDIGYLKGTEEEKIGPLIRPVMDNLEVLCKIHDDKHVNYIQELFDRGLVVAQALAYMRGRSISDTWLIIDEAQNMTPTQAFGIISRVGEGTKVILAGDPDQIDNPNLDRRNNGLTFASERMRGSPLCAQVTFEDRECVRSKLALDAITRLTPKGYRMGSDREPVNNP